MVQEIGLFIQSEFFDLAGPSSHSDEEEFTFQRIRRQRREGYSRVTEYVTQNKVQKINLGFSSCELSVLKGTVSAPAILFTAGFETWLGLQNHSHSYGMREVLDFSLSNDRVFGIQERTLADGALALSPQIEELQSIAIKLKSMDITHVALCFMHSHVNPSNEKLVATFFKEAGFQVVPSSEWCELPDEVMRWSHTLVSTLNGKWIQAEVQNLANELKLQGLSTELTIEGTAWKPHLSCSFFQGLEGTLERWMGHQPQIDNMLFLGIENFLWGSKDSHSNALVHSLQLQPTTFLNSSVWGIPLAQKQAPLGVPMLLNSSLRPTLFDLFFEQAPVLRKLFDETTQQKHQRKLEEVLFSLCASQIANRTKYKELTAVIFEHIAQDLFLWVCKNRVSDQIYLAGEFAPLFVSLFRKYRSTGMEWIVVPNAPFVEVQALIHTSQLGKNS